MFGKRGCLCLAASSDSRDGSLQVNLGVEMKTGVSSTMYNRNTYVTENWTKPKRSTTMPKPSSTKRAPVLRGACVKSARSVIFAIWRASPGKASADTITDLVNSLTGVIEQSTQLLLAGKQVRVIEDNDALTTQEAADLLNVSRPHLVKLLETGQIPHLPNAGRHRRVARAAVLKYQRQQQTQSAPCKGG